MSAEENHRREVHRTLDFALRVGEMLLSNGAGAADVTVAMDSICRHYGLRFVMIDVTFTSLNATYQERSDDFQVSLRRNVNHREIDYDDLTRVDHLLRAVLGDELDFAQARSELARISSTGHVRRRWRVTVAWGIMGAAVAILLGGDWIVASCATVATAGIDVIQYWLYRRRIPVFYHQVLGAIFATLIAVGVYAAGIPVDSSLVITAGIIALLAGLGFIGAIQDALSGFYITANARILEVMLATAGIIVGVGAGLSLGRVLGVTVAVDPGVTEWTQVPVMALGAAVAAAAFAYASYAPLRALAPSGIIGGVAALAYLTMVTQGFERPVAAGVAAIGIGFVSFQVAAWFRIPTLVVLVTAIVPLLPGLSIYRALTLMSEGQTAGIIWLVTAAGVAIALASGAILGEYMAQPIHRESRRLESRLSGPRLVGPMRAASVRPRKKKRSDPGN